MDSSDVEIVEDEFSDDIFDDWHDEDDYHTASPQSVASLVVLDDSESTADSDGDDTDIIVEDSDAPESSIGGGDSSSRQSSQESDDSLFVGRGGNLNHNLLEPDLIISRVEEERRRVTGLLADARARLRRIETVVDLELHEEFEAQQAPEGSRAAAQRGRESYRREARRHHPYRNSQPQQNNPIDRNRAPRRRRTVDDELVEMEVAPARRSRGPSSNRRTPLADVDVIIDLTGEPSSPELGPPVAARRGAEVPNNNNNNNNNTNANINNQGANRNPRRQTSFLQRTPSLARSDGSLLGNGSRSVPYDLTMDDDPAPPPPPPPYAPAYPVEPPLPRHNAANPNLNSFLRDNFLGFAGFRAAFHMPGIARAIGDFVNRSAPDIETQIIGVGGPANPLGNNIPDLRYAFGPIRRVPDPPQPKHVPPPPAPEGFTRNTGAADDENAIVCAGCEGELHFCEEDEAELKSRPAKKARSRKDMEEHWFWALKDCGHVYCKACYEKRTIKRADKTPFRQAADTKKALCSIPDCKTEITPKYSWVGLFL